MIKNILFLCALLSASIAGAQTPKRVEFGGLNPWDTAHAGRHLYIDSTVRLSKYSTTDTNIVAGFDSRGFIVPRTKGSGSTVTTAAPYAPMSDQNIYSTNAPSGAYPAFPVYELDRGVHYVNFYQGLQHVDPEFLLINMTSNDGFKYNRVIDTPIKNSASRGYGIDRNGRQVIISNRYGGHVWQIKTKPIGSTHWDSTSVTQFAFNAVNDTVYFFGKFRPLRGTDTMVTTVARYKNGTNSVAVLWFLATNFNTHGVIYCDTTRSLNECDVIGLPDGSIGLVARQLEPNNIPRLYKANNINSSFVAHGGFGGKIPTSTSSTAYPPAISYWHGGLDISFGFRGDTRREIRHYQCPYGVFADSTLIGMPQVYYRSQTANQPSLAGGADNNWGYLTTSPDTVNDILGGVFYDLNNFALGASERVGIFSTALNKQNYAQFSIASVSVPKKDTAANFKKGWTTLMDGNYYQDADTLTAISAPETGWYAVQITQNWGNSSAGTYRDTYWYNDSRNLDATGQSTDRELVATYRVDPYNAVLTPSLSSTLIGWMQKGRFFTFAFQHDAASTQNVSAVVTIKKINP